MMPKSRTPFENFNEAVESLMRVPHSEIKKALEKEKREKAAKKRAKKRPAHSSSVSDHASNAAD